MRQAHRITEYSQHLAKVYDVVGNEIRTLVNGFKSAGSYPVSFNASNLASGMYFYRLQTNGFVSIKKMILLK
ncbi:MAG: T9SS type A sorting domain-containing protein [Ignavibacteriaceae bacterium]